METKGFKTVVKIVFIASFAITLLGLSSAYIPEIKSFIDGVVKNENLFFVVSTCLMFASLVDLVIEPPPETIYS